ncbi:hypothetical protein EKE94_18355, partial [Mesobaculum littorinae]
MNDQSDVLQAERILGIATPLGDDQLLAQKLSVRKAISDLFEIRGAVRSKLPDLTPADLLGKLVDVSVEIGNGDRRSWNAIVTDISADPMQSRGLRSYDLVLRPQLWLLSQTSDCRIRDGQECSRRGREAAVRALAARAGHGRRGRSGPARPLGSGPID